MKSFSRALRVALIASATAFIVSVSVKAARPTPEERGRQAEAQCRAGYESSIYYDCACLGEEEVKRAAARGKPEAANSDPTVWRQCAQTDEKVLKDFTFRTCEPTAKARRTDHAEYCGCVSDHFAKEFLANANIANRQRQHIMLNAMQACGQPTDAVRVKPSREGPEWTAAGLEKQRAEQEASCKKDKMNTAYVDCACASRKAMELATAPGESSPPFTFYEKAVQACPQPDRSLTAGLVFDDCILSPPGARKGDESFCHCTADEVVKRFAAQKVPQATTRWRRALRQEAMKACGL